MSGHRCHARSCTVDVPPRFLMCRKHWRMVPTDLQRDVWRTYEPGQEVRKDPTPEYLDAAEAAIDAVARTEAHAQAELDGQCRLFDDGAT